MRSGAEERAGAEPGLEARGSRTTPGARSSLGSGLSPEPAPGVLAQALSGSCLTRNHCWGAVGMSPRHPSASEGHPRVQEQRLQPMLGPGGGSRLVASLVRGAAVVGSRAARAGGVALEQCGAEAQPDAGKGSRGGMDTHKVSLLGWVTQWGWGLGLTEGAERGKPFRAPSRLWTRQQQGSSCGTGPQRVVLRGPGPAATSDAGQGHCPGPHRQLPSPFPLPPVRPGVGIVPSCSALSRWEMSQRLPLPPGTDPQTLSSISTCTAQGRDGTSCGLMAKPAPDSSISWWSGGFPLPSSAKPRGRRVAASESHLGAVALCHLLPSACASSGPGQLLRGSEGSACSAGRRTSGGLQAAVNTELLWEELRHLPAHLLQP